MTPEYLEALADRADPDQLWRLPGLEQLDLPAEQRMQLDTGIALRRHASHLRNLEMMLEAQRSLLITPLSSNSTAVMGVPTPPKHARLRRENRSYGGRFLDALRERLKRPPKVFPICADTGEPKNPRACWNVRCQLGNKCCRDSVRPPMCRIPGVDPGVLARAAATLLTRSMKHEGLWLDENGRLYRLKRDEE
jgi:hypothetical protein